MLLAGLLAFPAAAGAEILNPPGGPVYVDDVAVDQVSHRDRDRADPPRTPRAERAGRGRLRAAMMEQFDVNGDGRLGPRERMRARRVLRGIERRLAGQGQRRRGARLRQFIQRHDINGDGNVGPREVPHGAADRLRRFDRDGDGWVEPRELRDDRRGRRY